MANFVKILNNSNKEILRKANEKYIQSAEKAKDKLLLSIEESNEITEKQILDLLKLYILIGDNKYDNEINMIYITLAHTNLKEYLTTVSDYSYDKDAAIEVFTEFGPLAFIYAKYFNCINSENNLYDILMLNINYDKKTINKETLKDIYNKYKDVKFITRKGEI